MDGDAVIRLRLEELREAIHRNDLAAQKQCRDDIMKRFYNRVLDRIRFLLRQFPRITESSGDIFHRLYLKIDELLKQLEVVQSLRTEVDLLRFITARVRWTLLEIARTPQRTEPYPEESWQAPPDSIPSVPSLAAELENRERLYAAMDKLSEQHRLLIEWITIDQETNETVGVRLGVHEKTIRRWHLEAMFELKRHCETPSNSNE